MWTCSPNRATGYNDDSTVASPLILLTVTIGLAILNRSGDIVIKGSKSVERDSWMVIKIALCLLLGSSEAPTVWAGPAVGGFRAA